MKRLLTLSIAAAALLPATVADAQGRLDWRPGAYRLVGVGVPALFPELRNNPRGRAFVMRNFDWNRDGRINRREADAANRAFLRENRGRRNRFDWNAPGRVVVVEETTVRPGGWNRGAMRDYGFRQTSRGATLSLQEDVLFATDSAVLRPGAIDKLRALADYLRNERGVRVAIDGHTDARGTNAHNQALSERRAASVRDAFDQLGVTRARFSVQGFGESRPVASNASAAGMRQNRRVEITLLGRRATEFGG